jgi:hypothetical protein
MSVTASWFIARCVKTQALPFKERFCAKSLFWGKRLPLDETKCPVRALLRLQRSGKPPSLQHQHF